ncbi:MAG: hypothetical protein K2Q09_00970 [Phycisphaerales bacterium]|nr:hypothetical protein [Phycisphaerales bacterium]
MHPFITHALAGIGGDGNSDANAQPQVFDPMFRPVELHCPLIFVPQETPAAAPTNGAHDSPVRFRQMLIGKLDPLHM